MMGREGPLVRCCWDILPNSPDGRSKLWWCSICLASFPQHLGPVICSSSTRWDQRNHCTAAACPGKFESHHSTPTHAGPLTSLFLASLPWTMKGCTAHGVVGKVQGSCEANRGGLGKQAPPMQCSVLAPSMLAFLVLAGQAAGRQGQLPGTKGSPNPNNRLRGYPWTPGKVKARLGLFQNRAPAEDLGLVS